MRGNYLILSCMPCVLHAVSVGVSFAQPDARQLILELTLLEKPAAKDSGKSSSDAGRRAVSIALGMPISIRLTMANEGNQAIEVLTSLDPSYGFVHLSLVDEGGAKQRFTTMRWETKDVVVPRRMFKPGERLRHETFLFGRLAKDWIRRDGMKHVYLFPCAGTYQLFARYECPDPPIELESNRVTVQVGPAIQGWSVLKEAQIVALMEGESRTNAEHRHRLARVRRILESMPQNPITPWLSAGAEQGKPRIQSHVPVDPELRRKVEAVFQGFLTAHLRGDIAQCVKLVAEDYRGWNRAKQREEFQEDIDKIDKLRRRGVAVELSGRVLSVVRSGKDVVIKGVVLYREGSQPSEDQTVRCRLTKQGDKWLIQQWDRLSQ